MNHLLSDLELSTFRNKLNKLTLPRTDNFWTRFKQFFLIRDQSELTGTVSNYEFVIWTYDSHLTGAFFPIFYGTFTAYGTGTSIHMRTKMNEIGIFITVLIYGMIAYALTTGIIIQEDNSFNFLIRRIGVAILIFSLFAYFPIFLYRHVRNRVLEFLTNELELKRNAR